MNNKIVSDWFQSRSRLSLEQYLEREQKHQEAHDWYERFHKLCEKANKTVTEVKAALKLPFNCFCQLQRKVAKLPSSIWRRKVADYFVNECAINVNLNLEEAS